jgi:hypothetical protein
MITSVAARIASVTAADIFGGVSMNTHSTPSCFATFNTPGMQRFTVLSRSASVSHSSSRSSFQISLQHDYAKTGFGEILDGPLVDPQR